MADLIVRFLRLLPAGIQTLLVGGACGVFLVLAVPYARGVYSLGEHQTARSDWTSPVAEKTANLVAEIASGSAPRDAAAVPYWHHNFKTLEDLGTSLDELRHEMRLHRARLSSHEAATRENTAWTRALSSEIEDRRHHMPVNDAERRHLDQIEPYVMAPARQPPPVAAPPTGWLSRWWQNLWRGAS